MRWLQIKDDSCLKKIIGLSGLFFIASMIIFFLYFLLLIYNEIPQRDVAARYAPMADAFGRGDYFFAFHPKFQLLHPLVSGIFVKIFHIDGFTATKCSSLLFYIFGAFPLFALLKEVFHTKVAFGGLVIYLFASRLLILAYSGMRESCKIFAILMLAYGAVCVWKECSKLKGYVILGIASGIAACTRNDLLLYAVSVLFICSVIDVRQHIIAWRSGVAVGTALLAGLPEIVVNYYICGYAVPGSRFIILFEELFQVQPTLFHVLVYGVFGGLMLFFILLYAVAFLLKWKYGTYSIGAMLLLGLLGIIIYITKAGFLVNAEMVGDFIGSIFQGLFPFWGIIALLTGIYLLWKKKWTRTDSFILFLILLFVVEQIGQILVYDRYLYVSHRYLLPVTPLFFGWCAIGIMVAWQWISRYLQEKYRNILMSGAIVIAVFFFLFDAASPIIKSRTRKDVRNLESAVMSISKEIRNDYKGPHFSNIKISPLEYQNNAMPRIYFEDHRKLVIAAYFAGGRATDDISECEYLISPCLSSPHGFVLLKKGILVRHTLFNIWKRKI